MPYISQVAAGVLTELQVYGNDYPTQDGTCVRDYLHVVDLAVGHRMALKALEAPGASHYNLGTGQGVSVKQMIDAFSRATQVPVAFRYAPGVMATWPPSGPVPKRRSKNWAGKLPEPSTT